MPRTIRAILIALAAMMLAGFKPANEASTANLHFYKQELRAYVDSGRYLAEVAAVAAEAMKFIETRVGKPGEKLAIVFDIDETVLSNMPAILANDFAWNTRSPCEFDASGKIVSPACGLGPWINAARGEALAPMRALYDLAIAKNIAVVFLTGRPVSMTDVSEKNLKAAGFLKYEQLILKPATPAFANLAAFKTDARRRITEQGFTIAANVGDQQSDLDGGFAERTFKVPNPFYFNP